MKKKKILALLMAACMCVSLTACGGAKEDEGSGETSQTQELEKTAEDTDTKVEPAKEAELNIMMSFPQYMDQWETYCRQFEEKCWKKKI